jgi:anti-sigma regulatory factor (Ser/Thr protein kinase)
VAFDWADEDPGPWAVLDMTGTDPTELSTARWWAETKLGTLAEPDRIDTVMVVAELLDNAYRHGGGLVWARLPCTAREAQETP